MGLFSGGLPGTSRRFLNPGKSLLLIAPDYFAPSRFRSLFLALITASALVPPIHSLHGAERVYDIIPESWVTFNGTSRDGLQGDRTFVLPAGYWTAGFSVKRLAKHLLLESNRFPEEGAEFELATGEGKMRRGPVIVARREMPCSPNLMISVDRRAVQYIRELGWDDFRGLQSRFEKWLLAQGEHGCGIDFLRKPRERFDQGARGQSPPLPVFEYELRAFWLECLQRSDYARMAAVRLQSAIGFRPPDQEHKVMGAIPLEVGMRLKIQWGGTANYSFGAAFPSSFYTRQTTTGTSTVEILNRDGRPCLGPGPEVQVARVPPKADWEHSAPDSTAPVLISLKDGTSMEVKDFHFDGRQITAKRSDDSPVTVPLDDLEKVVLRRRQSNAKIMSDSDNGPPLPFGKDVAPYNMGKAEIRPIFNDYDLRFLHMHAEGTRPARHLTLLIPCAYPKADGLGETEVTAYTHDARSSGDDTDESENHPDSLAARVKKSLPRRFVLWSSDTDASKEPSPDFSAEKGTWSYPPFVFANQTFVEVELPVSINGASAVWLPVYSRLGDLLTVHVRPVLAMTTRERREQPILTLSRVALPEQSQRDAEGSRYRFWVQPAAHFNDLPLRPGDAILTSP